MDRGAWWATISGVTKSQTRLNDFHFHCFILLQNAPAWPGIHGFLFVNCLLSLPECRLHEVRTLWTSLSNPRRPKQHLSRCDCHNLLNEDRNSYDSEEHIKKYTFCLRGKSHLSWESYQMWKIYSASDSIWKIKKEKTTSIFMVSKIKREEN